MRTLVRVGQVVNVEGRTLERHGRDVEVLETVVVHVAPWKEARGAQRWVSVRLEGGAHNGLEVFVPLEVFEQRSGLKIVDHVGPPAILE